MPAVLRRPAALFFPWLVASLCNVANGHVLWHSANSSVASSGDETPAGLVVKEGNNKFKILQLADVHLGEDPGGTWGPEQDKKTMEVIEHVLDAERPDLVVFSGDAITGEGLRSEQDLQHYWARLVAPLQARGIQWTLIFGNHDTCRTPGCHHVVPQAAGVAGMLETQALPMSEAGKKKLAERAAAREAERKAIHKADDDQKASKEKLHDVMADSTKKIYPHADQIEDHTVPMVKEQEKMAKDKSAAAETDAAAEEARSSSQPSGKISSSSSSDEGFGTGMVPGAGAADKSAETQVPGSDAGLVKAEGNCLKPSQPDPNVPAVPLNAVPGFASYREKLLCYDKLFALSRTAQNGIFISSGGGVSNYYLKLYSSKDAEKEDKPSAVLWFLDTGGGSFAEELQVDQVDWLRATAAELKRLHGPLPGMLYMHIPSGDYTHVDPKHTKSCFGLSDDFVTPTVVDQNLFSAIAAADIDWVFVGHNHGNDWCCPVKVQQAGGQRHEQGWNTHLCYGRHSGYGGYSTPSMYLRGARVVEVDLAMAKGFLSKQAGGQGISSWVRLEDGSESGASPALTQPTPS